MYNNPYYNQQMNIDRINTINNQIAELEKLRNQVQNQTVQPQMPTSLTQNFQLAPTSQSSMKFANSIGEVQKEIVLSDTPYFSKDLSVMWLKNTKGEIKSYELNEIVQKDEKDLKIDYLMAQIEELKKGMSNNESIANVNGATSSSSEEQKSANVSTVSKSNAKSK